MVINKVFLAGLRFVSDNHKKTPNDVLLIKREDKNIKVPECNFDKYSFGRVSLSFCDNCGLVKIFIANNKNDTSCTYVCLSMRANCIHPVIEICASNIDESIIAFSAYYYLYSIGRNVISIPGNLKVIDSKLFINYQDSGSKVIFFSENGNIYLHAFGNDEVVEYGNMISFYGYAESDLRNLLFSHGSRPFWSDKAMVRWVEFIDSIYIASDLKY